MNDAAVSHDIGPQYSFFSGGIRAAVIRVLITGIAVFLAVMIVPGIEVDSLPAGHRGSGAHDSEPIGPAHSLCADPSLDRPLVGTLSHCGQRAPSGTHRLSGQRILGHRILAGSRRRDRDQSGHHDPQRMDFRHPPDGTTFVPPTPS